MALYIYYRISDKGNVKEKLPGVDKYFCLANALTEFGKEYFYIIADNCSGETINYITSCGGGDLFPFEETSLGNSASFLYMVRKIIQKHGPDDYVYLLEDDYIHRPGSRGVLFEGLEIGEYVTLYDHPDKYLCESEQGNPFNDKKLQKTRIYVTQNAHWRETNSTTMTLACKVKTLQEDLPVWEKYCGGKTPDDFHAFMEISQNGLRDTLSFFRRRRKKEFLILAKNILTHKRPKKILSVLPSFATHIETEWLAPVVKWENLDYGY
ncbi:MAG: hypothetical protein LBQ88_03060 [Treponema sp.]|jgi:hypothetical protein|nr:hypothetical protein [Treponema sp.]